MGHCVGQECAPEEVRHVVIPAHGELPSCLTVSLHTIGSTVKGQDPSMDDCDGRCQNLCRTPRRRPMRAGFLAAASTLALASCIVVHTKNPAATAARQA